MPITSSAKKALRQSKTKHQFSLRVTKTYKKALKKAQTAKVAADIVAAISAIDRAAKKNTIHKNKAARLKSRLMKLAAKNNIVLKKTPNQPKTKTAKPKAAIAKKKKTPTKK